MHAEVSRETLKAALAAVKPAVATRSTLPICQSVLLSVGDDGHLSISATDLETAVQTFTPGGIGHGAVCVPFKALAGIVQKLPARSTVTIDATDDGKLPKVNVGPVLLYGHAPDDFPPIPAVDAGAPDVTQLSVAAADFAAALSRALLSVAEDDTRPILETVNLEWTPDEPDTAGSGTLSIVAADGFRLYVETLRARSTATGTWRWNLHRRSARAIITAAGKKPNGLITADLTSVRGAFACGAAVVTTQQPAGEFPNYRQLIPVDRQARVTVNRAAFQQAVELAGTVASMGRGITRLATMGDTLHVFAEHDGQEARSAVPAQADGSARVAINNFYLRDVVKSIPGEELVIDIQSPSQPIKVRSADCGTRTIVVMPMFVQWADTDAGSPTQPYAAQAA